jgi:hypothetical protein
MAAVDQRVQAILEAGDDPFMLLVRSHQPGERSSPAAATDRDRCCTEITWPRARRTRSAQVGRRRLHDHAAVPTGELLAYFVVSAGMCWRDALAYHVSIAVQLSLCCHPDKNQTEDAALAFHREWSAHSLR